MIRKTEYTNNPYELHLHTHTAHDLMIRNIGKNKTVLDVGCNDGYIGKLSDQSNEFYGIDYSEKSVKKAKQFYKDAIVYNLNNIKRLPWNIKFDVILLGDILEHLLDPEKTLTFLTKNHLQPGGRVIISLPNIANYQIRLKLLFGNFTPTESGILDKTHLHFYTFKTAEKLVESAGLKIISELGGTRRFWRIIKFSRILRSLLSINIVLICKK